MTRWPVAQQRPAVVESDADLIAGSYAWHEVCPRGGRGDAAFEKWRADFSAWCAERGTDPLALLRLRGSAKAREA